MPNNALLSQVNFHPWAENFEVLLDIAIREAFKSLRDVKAPRRAGKAQATTLKMN